MSTLTIAQAAQTLNVSEKSIRRYIQAGRLKATKVQGAKGTEYRIDIKELDGLKKPERGRPESQVKKRSQANKALPAKKTPSKIVRPVPPQPPTTLESQLNQEIESDFIQINTLMAQLEEKRSLFEKEKETEQTRAPHTSDTESHIVSLYQDLLQHYAQAQVKIGQLESELKYRPAQPEFVETMKRLERKNADQERIIQELYQTIRDLEQMKY